MGSMMSSADVPLAGPSVHNDDSYMATRYSGLRNYGNTCYLNSVLQSLYHFRPFRLQCLLQRQKGEGLLHLLGDLFWELQREKDAVVPKKFVQKLQAEKEMYQGGEHHDAHEFFIYLVNSIAEDLNPGSKTTTTSEVSACNQTLEEFRLSEKKRSEETTCETWMDKMFQGQSVYETCCLCCENVTRRKETFLDLSLDILDGSSLNGCIKQFESKELLNGTDKYFCHSCGCHQEAIRSLRLERVPQLLTVHLKRFKYVETDFGGAYTRLPYRVLLPLELRLNCTDPVEPCPLYELLAVVVHIGVSLYRGHYVACIKSDVGWLLYDDHSVEAMTDEQLQSFFSGLNESCGVRSGYLLFYQFVKEQYSKERQLSDNMQTAEL